MLRKNLVLLVLIMSASLAWAVEEADLLTSADLARFENPPADARIQYGEGTLQFGDLRIPSGRGPHPVAVFIHGGLLVVGFRYHTQQQAGCGVDTKRYCYLVAGIPASWR